MYDIIWLHIDIDADNRRRNPMPSNLGNSYSFLRVSVQQTFAVTFDEEYAKATGTKTETYNLIIAIIIAVIIVLGMNLVGSLLISALIIFPALSAMCVFGSFRAVTICSIILSIVAALTGMFISILGGTPVGATIVTVDGNYVSYIYTPRQSDC